MIQRKGSTMVMVIATIGILTILGLSISTMAAVNFKYKKVEETRKKTYYSAESGFDQAYSFVAKQIEIAISKGNEKVDEETKKLKDKYRGQYETGIHDSDYDNYMNINGTFKESSFVAKFQDWFKEGYTAYLNSGVASSVGTTNIAEVLKDKVYEKVNATYSSPPVVTVLDGYTAFSESSNKFNIPLRSEFSLVNNAVNVTRKLQADLEIKIPKFEDVSRYNIKSLTVSIEEASLLSNSLVTDGNIKVNNDSNVTINGYAHAYNCVDIAGSLNVTNGLVATNGDVKTSANKAKFTTSLSNVYCNNLQIPKGSSGCIININGSVNTKDDIELNGTNATIDIKGNYYGFSDGSTEKRHDMSSSIVINSPDIGSNTQIKIAGKNISDVCGREAPDPLPGIYISGTVYIGNDAGYQTGESVSVKGNYKAYSTPLSDLVGSEAKYNSDNINFEYASPLLLATTFKDNKELLVADKAKYIKLFKTQIGGLNLGNEKINLSNVMRSLGAYIDINDELQIDKGGFADGSITTAKLNMFNYHTNLLSDERFNPNTDSIIGSLEKSFKVDELVNMSSTDISGKAIGDYIFADKSAGSLKTTIFNNDSTTRIVIVGVGGDENPPIEAGDSSTKTKKIFVNSTTFTSTNPNIKGAIFTSGYVYVTGEVNYEGIIAAKGDIVFDGPGAKVFTANSDVAIKCIFNAEIENGVKPLNYYKKLTKKETIASSFHGDIDAGKISYVPGGEVEKLYNADISVGGVTSYSMVGALAIFKNMKRVN